MLKKFTVAMLVSAIVLSTVGCTKPDETTSTSTGGASSSGDGNQVPVVTIATSKDTSEWETWPTDFITEMEKELGVKIETQRVTHEQHDLAIASKSATFDIINAHVAGAVSKIPSILEAGFALELDPYLEEYGQDILKFEDRNNLFREFRSNGDGKLYFKGVQTGPENKNASGVWNGYIVRWDYYKEIGYPPINNDDDYLNALKKMQELHPTNDVGDPTYGLGNYNDSPLWAWTVAYEAADALSGIFLGSYVDMTDKTIFSKYTDDKAPYWKSMEFMNKAYHMDLLDPDIFIMKSDDLKEKVLQGSYMGALRTWDVGEYYDIAKKEDAQTLSGYMPVFPEQGGVSAWYGADPVAGWENNGYYITSECKTPEKAVEVLNYFDKPDVMRSYYTGAQKDFWEYDENKKPILTQKAVDMKTAGGDDWQQLGIYGTTTGGFMNGMMGSSPFTLHPDGGMLGLFDSSEAIASTLNPVQADYAKNYGVSHPGEVHTKQVEAGLTASRADEPKDLYLIGGTVPDDIKLLETNLTSLAESYIVDLVTANPEDFAKLKEQVKSDFVKAGAEELFTWAKAEYTKADATLTAAKDKHNID